jgi:hypothetical protein
MAVFGRYVFNDTIRRVIEQKVVAYYLLILNFILLKPVQIQTKRSFSNEEH